MQTQQPPEKAAMDNIFHIGDLVHLPQGTTLYRLINTDRRFIYDKPMPIRLIDRPTVGLILKKSIYDYYVVEIKNEEYMIKSEEAFIINGDTNVYKTIGNT